MSLAQEEQHLPATQPLPSPLHPQCASATPCAPSGLLSRPQQSKLQPYQRLLAAACKSHAIRCQPHAVLLLHPGPHCIHFPPPWAKACSQSRGLSRGGQVQDKPGLGRLRSSPVGQKSALGYHTQSLNCTPPPPFASPASCASITGNPAWARVRGAQGPGAGGGARGCILHTISHLCAPSHSAAHAPCHSAEASCSSLECPTRRCFWCSPWCRACCTA